MKCRAAQHLISAERDGALSPGERAELEAHLGGCANCRQAREALAEAANAWRAVDATASRLDVEHAWHAIRREIRGAGVGRGSKSATSWMQRILWTAVPVAAAAAIAVAVWTGGPEPIAPETGSPPSSWAQYVEVNDAETAPVVFVDEASGWVVVWASEPEGGQT